MGLSQATAPNRNPPAPEAEQLKLVATFHYVLAALAALFSCMPLLHLGFGIVLLVMPEQFGDVGQRPPEIIGWLFIIMAGVFILIGWVFAVLVLIAGRFVARRKHYMFCFVMGCCECLFMPFGTALGVFTIIVLNRPGVKEMFSSERLTSSENGELSR